MGLESANYLTGLNSAYPLSGDFVSAGDDHLRLIKQVLLNTFPNHSTAQNLPSTFLNAWLLYTTAAQAFDALAPTTTRGDLIVRGASSNQRLALGTSGY